METKTRNFVRAPLYIVGALLLTACLLIAHSLLQPLRANAKNVETNPAITKWSGDGLSLEIEPMPLDLVRAFFIGRGFDKSDAEIIAQSGCIFRSKMGNSGSKPDEPSITVELAKWQTSHGHSDGSIKKSGPRTREDWAKIWDTKSVSDIAKTAFHWALYPTRQSYQPTDYNWGLISFALPAGSKFDLEVHWLKSGVAQARSFKSLECGK